jgi:hypothetical protein
VETFYSIDQPQKEDQLIYMEATGAERLESSNTRRTVANCIWIRRESTALAGRSNRNIMIVWRSVDQTMKWVVEKAVQWQEVQGRRERREDRLVVNQKPCKRRRHIRQREDPESK